MNDRQLEKLAIDIRKLWVEERRSFELRTAGQVTGWGNYEMPKWDGGYDKNGNYNKPAWLRIAEFCTDNSLDPLVLIRAVFYKKHMMPQPNQAHGSKALESYRRYLAPGTKLEIKNDILNKFESQKSRVSAEVTSRKTYYGWDDSTAWRVVVSSQSLPLTPLFRYCVAKNQNWDELAEQHYKRAIEQYTQFSELYNEVWGDWIPSELKEKSHERESSSTTQTQAYA